MFMFVCVCACDLTCMQAYHKGMRACRKHMRERLRERETDKPTEAVRKTDPQIQRQVEIEREKIKGK